MEVTKEEDNIKENKKAVKLEEEIKVEESTEEDIDEEYNLKFYERDNHNENNNSNLGFNLRDIEGPIKFHSNGVTSDFEFENTNQKYRELDYNDIENQYYYDEVLDSEDGLISAEELLKAKCEAEKNKVNIKKEILNNEIDTYENNYEYKEGSILELEKIEKGEVIVQKVDEHLYEPRGLEIRDFINKRWFYILGTTSIILAMFFKGLLFSFVFMLALNGGKALVDDGKVLSGTLIIIVTYVIFILLVAPAFILYLKIVF